MQNQISCPQKIYPIIQSNVWKTDFCKHMPVYWKIFSKNQVNDFLRLSRKTNICHPNELNKARKKNFNSQFEQGRYAGEVVDFDLSVPLQASHGGLKDFCTLTYHYQYSRNLHLVGLHHKIDNFEAI